MKSRKIIKEFKPDVVIGTGGFASGAVVKVAQQMNIPTVIQEQNSYPGITNKMLSSKANAICVAYDGLNAYFKSNKIIKTGNPVRQDLLEIESKTDEARQFYGIQPDKKTVVILGGSLGARRINQLVEKELPFFKEQNVQVIWQCGKFYIDEYKKYHNNEDVLVYDFIERMDLLFAAADIIVSRAGASSVSELAIVGKPVIFIPSPNVAEDHQTKNAKSITDKNAAVLIKESELDQQFQEQMLRLLTNDQVVEALSNNIKTLALPNATKDIVNEIFKLVK
jgi:UDP-N-acetylglucosamine--N-acetylmuramyl-(pentapeptide) pyrophosphoryl-undecaprenol N-acetylglucosamine transferase